MSSKSESNERNTADYSEFFEIIRESGDGESKETSPHTSASEDDNNDPIEALIDVNRKGERRKDKKVSKIPVRQNKVSHNADVTKSTYGNSFYYQQLGSAEKAEIFRKISDVTQTEITQVDSNAKMSGENLSKAVNLSELDEAEGKENNVDNENFADESETKFELKRTGESCDSGIQKESDVSADIANKASILDDPILEAPEGFRTFSKKIICLSLTNDVSINGSECSVKVDRMSFTDIAEPKPCSPVAAIRDHDNVYEPEVDTCGWELNKDKIAGSGIETPNENDDGIYVSNESADEKINANSEFAAPSETVNEYTSEDCPRAFTTNNGGVLKDNDQIQSNSISIQECDAVEHERICDNNATMIGLLNDNAKELQTRVFESPSTKDADLNNAELRQESSFSDDDHPEGYEPDSSVSNNGAYACAGNEPTLTTAKPSIAIGVERCAQAPRCSRISVATVCAASTSNFPKSTVFTENSTISIDVVTEKPIEETLTPSRTRRCNEITTDKRRTLSLRSEIASVTSAKQESHLFWTFKNGRLVFETAPQFGATTNLKSEQSSRPDEVSQCLLSASAESSSIRLSENHENYARSQKSTKSNDDNDIDEIKSVLCSRDLNRRRFEGQSRLKRLENKLKRAGITDGKTSPNCFDDKQAEIFSQDLIDKNESEQVVDKLTHTLLNPDFNCDNLQYENDDLKNETVEVLLPEANGSGDFTGGSLCEFDVRQVGAFSGYNESEFFLVYDELENSTDEDDCEHERYHTTITDEMRGDGSMGTDGERAKQHNPDRENLKSLLKKPGRGRDVKKNRVVFNENKNEFFDADYIILIREECDYDDEEDDGVCTCNDHEMVRLTCCEPNCNCNLYEGYGTDPTPQSPKFAPPLEFVDAVTLSPPEGYKDMELGEQQLLALQQMAMRGQRAAVCRDCSATHEDDGEGSQSDNEEHCDINSDQEEIREETIKTDQSQQTTPTTPLPADHGSESSQYLAETTAERKAMRDLDDEMRSISPNPPHTGSPISGILKGGRLWKQHSLDVTNARNIELQQATDSSVTSDEESNGNKRSVRFTESNDNKRDVCDGAVDRHTEELIKEDDNQHRDTLRNAHSASPESTEMLLTLKLGNHILISNNSLKPNSAVRQLFPCSKPLSSKPGENDSVHQYLVTAESLRAFEEAKRSKLPQIIQSDETDESIKRAIERNTLRRSLIRYEPRPKKKEQKSDNSLVEQIKKLTCDVDEDVEDPDDIQQRASPPGEEARKSPETNHLNKTIDKSFSPSSSSTTSSNSSSVSSTYKKITDLFAKREKQTELQTSPLAEPNQKGLNQIGPTPDLANTVPHQQDHATHHYPIIKSNSANDTKKQFLSTLAPLTACVSSVTTDDHYYHISHHVGDRTSITSSVGTDYSLEDIDEGLKNEDEDAKRNAPDVVVGTPSASESGDELAMFVQQDASRIERIKKKYQQDSEEDEHDDYGFNKRPSVRGIKPRFGTTTEILQQIQNQLQPTQAGVKANTHVTWPYYSEASLSGLDNNKSHNINQNVPQYQYTYVTEEMKTKMYIQHYRPTSLVEDNIYQNCTNQRCNREIAYKTNANHVYSPVMRIGGGCSDIYHQAPSGKSRNGRPESPPPFDVARNVHQTMVYIPYNHIESYQPACISPNPQYAGTEKCYARVVNQNQINRYAEPLYHNQPRMTQPSIVDVNVVKQIPKPTMRLPYPLPNPQTQSHMINSRSESPLPGQFSTARSTQTMVANPTVSCNYYQQISPRYRPMVGPVVTHTGVTWNGESIYSNKVNRHSFPSAVPRYPAPDSISLTDSESQYGGQLPNGYRQTIETTFSAQKDSLPNSPTKPRFIERGVPEGAASVSPQDSTAQTTSTMTSPTSPQNPPTNPKPLYYAMNV